MTELEEYKATYQEMLDDCNGEASPGWYAWISFDLVERMAEKLEAQEAVVADYENDDTPTRRELAWATRKLKTLEQTATELLITLGTSIDPINPQGIQNRLEAKTQAIIRDRFDWGMMGNNDAQWLRDLADEGSADVNQRERYVAIAKHLLAVEQTVFALAFQFDCQPSEVHEKVMAWKTNLRGVLEEWDWLYEPRPHGSEPKAYRFSGDPKILLACYQDFLVEVWKATWPLGDTNADLVSPFEGKDA
ncbi:MAG: hypothetical protein ACC700_19860 [Anaerolineales bacterium]